MYDPKGGDNPGSDPPLVSGGMRALIARASRILVRLRFEIPNHAPHLSAEETMK
jgi:hypothetical protein